MDINIVLIIILIISFFLALRSMSDFDYPDKIRQLIARSKIKGSIVFFQDKIRHYD